jgi:hypothetical protein
MAVTLSLPKSLKLRRRWLVLAAGLLILAAIPFAGVAWRSYGFRRELNALVAELDRTDPRWRLDDLEADRAVVSDGENAALVVADLWKRMQTTARGEMVRGLTPFRYPRQFQLPPDEPLDAERYRTLIDALEYDESLVSRARSLARRSQGRAPIVYSANGYSTPLGHVNDCGTIIHELLWLLPLVHAHEGDVDAGLEAALIILNTARSIGDEPCSTSQRCCLFHAGTAAQALERALAHGEPSAARLTAIHAAFATELAHPGWVIGLRGDRAMSHQYLTAVENRRASIALVREIADPATSRTGWRAARDWIDDRLGWDVRSDHVWLLKYYTRLIAGTRRPLHEQADDLRLPDGVSEVIRGATAVTRNGFESYRASRAELCCAVVALAAERFRLARGRWPESPAELRPDWLGEIPVNPYDGRPVQWELTNDGLCVFCETGTGARVPFRLWNPDARHRIAAAERGEGGGP